MEKQVSRAEERLADLTHLLVDHVDAEFGLIGFHNFQIAEQEKTGRGVTFRLLLDGLVRQQATGDLLADKAIEGFIRVEGVDDVIAIPPTVFGKDIVGCTDLIGVAHEVQPVPRPSLAEMLAFQQPVD